LKKTLKSWAAAGGRRREVIKRAASDVARGLKNTDCRASSQPDCPRPARAKRSGK
jgi:hypothetical protein